MRFDCTRLTRLPVKFWRILCHVDFMVFTDFINYKYNCGGINLFMYSSQ